MFLRPLTTLSKKPFYVYFRILHAYTIIYLKYRVFCSRGCGHSRILICGAVCNPYLISYLSFHYYSHCD